MLKAAATLPVGATVTVTLPEQYLLLGAALVYGVPLAALLFGASRCRGYCSTATWLLRPVPVSRC